MSSMSMANLFIREFENRRRDTSCPIPFNPHWVSFMFLIKKRSTSMETVLLPQFLSRLAFSK